MVEPTAKSKVDQKGPPEPENPNIVIPPKGSKAQKTYLWNVDAKGNLVKVESSTAKRSYALLPQETQVALTQYLLATNVVPTDSARKSLWGKIVDGAIVEYKGGRQTTPVEVLADLLNNNPNVAGVTTNAKIEFDPITAEATIKNIALDIGFDTTQLTEADKQDFLNKINAAAAEGTKTTQKVLTTGGYETVTTPSTFNAKTFTENWLWAKVNIGDTKALPAKAFTSLSTVKNVLRNNGIDYLGDKEVNQLAVQLASGATTEAKIKADYAAQAAKNYPLLADRLASTPGATVRDLVTPYLSAVAKWWEIDPDTIDLSNPAVDKALRPDGTQGKAPMMSLADFTTMLKMSPEAEKTTWANESARSAATGLARAMGFGV